VIAAVDEQNGEPLKDDDGNREMTDATVDEGLARQWRPSARLLWTLAAILLVATVAVAATLGRAAWQARAQATNEAEALAAGRQLAVNFVTMRADSFDADAARVLSGATGGFKKEYESTLSELKPVVTANKTVSTVERAEASLVSADADSARVIVGVVAPTTNTASPTPQKKTYRLRLDLAKVGAEWKVNNLEFVS
jgi:Mce-associated membrane protein